MHTNSNRSFTDVVRPLCFVIALGGMALTLAACDKTESSTTSSTTRTTETPEGTLKTTETTEKTIERDPK
ncbi:MAG: hypothetical protein SGJ11_02175 [Phycisphaerae bacterium]|nr:hypothetical protein [Phycisphaerae bacterium]